MSSTMTMDMDSQSSPDSKPALSPTLWVALIAGAMVIAYLVIHSLMPTEGHGGGHGGPVEMPHFWGLGILPFVGILACIAILPLLPATHHWWESNLNRLGVSLLMAGLTVVYYLWSQGLHSIVPMLGHAVIAEYIPFIILLFCLYVISGGICIKGDLAAHPGTNTAFLAVGAGIASFIGTTGASMLLIRPLLQTNSERKNVVHTVVFFILLVSNIGGTLLPIGDPPLFLGYLKGVNFWWTLGLWKPWALCCGILLVIYFIWDTFAYKKESKRDIQRDETMKEPLRLTGWINLLWLGGIVACVAFIVPGEKIFGFTMFPFLRELLMLGFVMLSLKTTPKGAREYNQFNYAAILEVAALFIGIFIAMQVPVEVLKASGAEITQVLSQPWQYFWVTGGLSSVLDNAPTYVVFFELGQTVPTGAEAVPLSGGHAISGPILVAISLGAVFMGALTYIGNGPNFMVKAIAEQSGVRMPSFFGYMFKYTIPVLVPVFIIITLVFLLT